MIDLSVEIVDTILWALKKHPSHNPIKGENPPKHFEGSYQQGWQDAIEVVEFIKAGLILVEKSDKAESN